VSSETTSTCFAISEEQMNCLQGRTGMVTLVSPLTRRDSVARDAISVGDRRPARACAVSPEMSIR
jgi:hypothetical protein